MSRYQFIEQLAATEPVQMLYHVLHVSPAGYLSVARPGRAAVVAENLLLGQPAPTALN